MSTLWALVANTGGAKIFEIKGLGKTIVKVQHIDNPDGRKKASEVFSDRPGRSFDRQGEGRHALGTQIDLHLHEIQLFAKKLGDVLIKAHENKSFDQLALIAPPQFLGVLKQRIPEYLQKVIFKEVNKDLPDHLSENDIIEHIREYLDLWNKEERKVRR